MDLGDTCMSAEEQHQFREMLVRNEETIAFSMEELGHCDWTPMKIKVSEDTAPCVTRPYSYSPQKMDIIDEQIRELLKLGIIEPSTSAWRSPLVVVQKKDGKARLCTDYRVLNTLTEDETYPMPTARSLFLYMAYRKPTIFTAIDLLSGYHQCDLHPDSRKYSSFESPTGVWQWTRVPFGLRQSPWQFTKIMSMALQGLMPRTCLAYLDDIIVFDPTVESHILNVEKVLQALGRTGLTIKPSKCEWGRSEIRFLGHVVTPEGLKTQPKVTKKVQEFGRPHDKHTVRSFLGLCNYYRSFIPHLADTAVPLNHLLKNKVPFVWSEECETAFRSIQESLVNPPLLIHPEIGGHFYILTDASDGACGAAICHLREGIFRPVVYYGYTFGKAERNYSVTEREGLAVIKVLKAHDSMLSGAKITILTDHQPLIPLLQQAAKAPSQRLKRWGLALTDFDYQIYYTPGENHHLPDFLSRVVMKDTPTRESEEEEEEFEPEVGCELLAVKEVAKPRPKLRDKKKASCELLEMNVDVDELSAAEFRTEQWKDPECQPLLAFMVNEELPDQWELAKVVLVKVDRMGVNRDGVLCKFDDPKKKKKGKGMAGLKARIMVPATMVQRVLYLLHDDILCGGHVGITAMNTKVIEKFYWKNLYMDIVEYVRACERCALRKRAPHFKSKAKSWDRPDYPWQVVQTDFIGPLRKSKEGYFYILTFIDLLTGWPEAFPTKRCTAATAATMFLQHIVCRYGKIEVLNSDRGPSFISKLFKEITGRLMCKQRFTSARMPQGNARVERLHKSLEDLIGCYVTEDHENWPDLLPIALWNVRSTISTRTGFSPYALTFGRDNAAMGYPNERPAFDAGDDHDWFLKTKHCIEQFDEVAKENTQKYEETLRGRLDKTARPVQLKEGEFVFYYDPTCAENNTSKFAARYRGPYRIEEAVTDNRVKLRSLRTGKTIPHQININKLKRAYCGEQDEETEGEPNEPATDDGGESEPDAPKEGSDRGKGNEGRELRRGSTTHHEPEPLLSEENEDKESSESGGEAAGAKGGSGLCSRKSVGATTQEQPQKRKTGTSGVERDQADWDHHPQQSTPLVEGRRTQRRDKTKPRKAESRRVTTTPGNLDENSADHEEEGESMGENEANPSKLSKIKKGEPRESESETPNSEGESDCPFDNKGNSPSIKLKRRDKDRKVYEDIQRRGEKQNSTLNNWSEKRIQEEPDSDAKERTDQEKKVQKSWRVEQQMWEIRREKEGREKERKLKAEARAKRAINRRIGRDKVAQKGATAISEEEVESEDLESREKNVAAPNNKRKNGTSSSSE